VDNDCDGVVDDGCLWVCADAGDCNEGEFCEYAAQMCGGRGVCRQLPVNCPDDVAPVCGCDLQTYPNDCTRQAASVSLLGWGACELDCADADGDGYGDGNDCFGPDCDDTSADVHPGVDEVCNGIDDDCDGDIDEGCELQCNNDGDCPNGTFCSSEPGVCAGPGVCETIPDYCVPEDEPVCGCDGLTYSGDCLRRRASVALLAEGECPLGCADGDGDGFGAGGGCAGPDCNDNDDDVHPGMPEACDGVDQDCDGTVDEGCVFLCEDNLDCNPDELCEHQPAVCGGVGVCVARPQSCDPAHDLVCGCDGNTYANDCTRQEAGVALDRPGSCAVGGGE